MSESQAATAPIPVPEDVALSEGAPAALMAAPLAESGQYEISGRDQIVRSRMLSLELVNDRLAKNLRMGIFNFVRKTPQVHPEEVAVSKYDTLLKGLSEACIFNLVSLKPLRGNALLIVDAALLHGIIDCQFGGIGEPIPSVTPRELSATELKVMERLIQLIGAEYRQAWSSFYPLEVEFLRTEVQPQMLDIAAPGEMVVCSNFSLQIGAIQGSLKIWIPYATLEPIRDVLYASGSSRTDRSDRRWLKVLTREIQSADVLLVAELAGAQVTVEHLLAMKPGDFIELDRPQTIHTRVDGVPLFECHYGTHNGRYAIRVEKSLQDIPENDWLGEQYAA